MEVNDAMIYSDGIKIKSSHNRRVVVMQDPHRENGARIVFRKFDPTETDEEPTTGYYCVRGLHTTIMDISEEAAEALHLALGYYLINLKR